MGKEAAMGKKSRAERLKRKERWQKEKALKAMDGYLSYEMGAVGAGGPREIIEAEIAELKRLGAVEVRRTSDPDLGECVILDPGTFRSAA